MAEPVWFHIDVNSAFLSWTAAYRTLVEGRNPDLRDIPAVIANDKNLRTSIVLAKSTPAKKYGVKTPFNDKVVEIIKGIEDGKYTYQYKNVEQFRPLF